MKISINPSSPPTLPFGPSPTSRSLLALALVTARACGLILQENELLSMACDLLMGSSLAREP